MIGEQGVGLIIEFYQAGLNLCSLDDVSQGVIHQQAHIFITGRAGLKIRKGQELISALKGGEFGE